MRQRTVELLKRSFGFFRSARMTVIIISVLLVLYLLGLVIPQKTFIRSAQEYAAWKTAYPAISAFIEFLHLNEIYLAPVTVACLFVFFANLIVVMAYRFPVILRRMYLLGKTAEGRSSPQASPSAEARTFRIYENSASTAEAIRAFLKRRLWTIVGGDGKKTFLAVKNRYSPAGFLFFHASFVLCLVGGLLVMYTRFAGSLILTEGQEFVPDLKLFRHIYRDPKVMKELPPFSLQLDRVAPQYEKEVSTDLDMDMIFTYKGAAERTRVKVNQPIVRQALSILARDVGVSPLMVLRDASGREITGSYFSLNVMKGDPDSFEFPEWPYRFTVWFYPDYFEQHGLPSTRSRSLANPVIKIMVSKEGKTVYDGLLPLKQRISFDGLTLAFEEVRYWVEFYVVREYGNYSLYAGFFLGVAGLILRLLFYQKLLMIVVADVPGGSSVSVDGKSEYYQYSFRGELDSIVDALRASLAGEQNSDRTSPAGRLQG